MSSDEATPTPDGFRDWPLTTRVAWIAGQMRRFAKKGTVTGKGSYKFAGIDDMADAIRPLMADMEIAMWPGDLTVVECAQYVRERVNDAGARYETIQWRTVVRVDWIVACHALDADSRMNRDTLKMTTVGEALDTSDKSANKAQTAARKYAMLGLLNLSTGDEPDPDTTRPGDDGEQRAPQRRQPAPPKERDPDATVDQQGAFAEALTRFDAIADAQAHRTWCAWFAKTYRLEPEAVKVWADAVIQGELPDWPNALTGPKTEEVTAMLHKRAGGLEEAKKAEATS